MSTVDKAIDLLLALAARPGGAGNLELSRAAAIDKSTSHRLLATLERRGLVRRDPSTRHYRLGARLLEIAVGSAVNPTLAARPILHRLAELAGESASFSLLVDASFVPVDSVHAPHEMRFSPEVGTRYPLNAGAAGKAILAFQPELAERLLRGGELPGLTARTITAAPALGAELERIRADGYATSEGERVLGGCSIAAPIVGPAGRAVGAVSVSSVCARCDRGCLRRHLPALRSSAAELADRLISPAPPA